MRFAWKLLLLVVIAVVMQAWIQRHASDIDEAQFAARCLIGKMCGRASDDPEMLDAALALRDRQLERVARHRRRRVAVATSGDQATTRPAWERAASAADELEWSLACPAARIAARGEPGELP